MDGPDQLDRKSARRTLLARLARWYVGAAGGLIVLQILFDPLLLVTAGRNATAREFWLPTLALAGLTGIYGFAAWRVRRRAKACGFNLCKHCGYDLRSLDETGPCPECGVRFITADLQQYWKRGG